MSIPPLAAILLAGGRSSRMGQPKAWLDWGGRPLLLHVLAQLRAVCRGPIVVVGAPGQVLPDLPEGTFRIDDPPEDARGGPLVGLLAGLRALAAPPETVVYLGACDTALLDAAYVRFITAPLVADATLRAALPRDPPTLEGTRFAHPLASAVRLGPALEQAEALVAAGVRRPIALFEALAARYVDRDALPDPAVLATCNTPEELARLRARTPEP
ncbi:MAG: NTP transferase domain-containing protein [Nannocystaceae bacterium]|nr:NTP transferase domain-containing protein [Myxococcales bacterium]